MRLQQDDPVVLRELEARQLAAVTLAELRSVREKERDVRAQLRGERQQPCGRQGLREQPVREP